MSKKSYRPLKVRELFRGMEIPETQYRAFRRLIKEMLAEVDWKAISTHGVKIVLILVLAYSFVRRSWGVGLGD